MLLRTASAGLCLLLAAGCSGKDSAGGGDSPEKLSSSAAATTESAEAAQSTAAGEPLPLAEVLASVDFAKFKFPAEATRTETRATSAFFSIASQGAEQTQAIVADLRAQLAAAGWKELPASDPVVGDWGCQLFSAKRGVILQTSVGVSRGAADGDELNATLLLVGCVDARDLPRPEPRSEQSALPSMVLYTTKLDLKQLREFYARELAALGWTECEYKEVPGVELPPAVVERSQSFLKRSSRLTMNYFPPDPADAAAETRVFAQATVVKIELPIIPDARLVQFADDPPYLYYYCPQDPPEIESFYHERLAAAGYELEPVKPAPSEKDDESSKISWLATPATGDPLLVEFLDLGEHSVVQIKKK